MGKIIPKGMLQSTENGPLSFLLGGAEGMLIVAEVLSVPADSA